MLLLLLVHRSWAAWLLDLLLMVLLLGVAAMDVAQCRYLRDFSAVLEFKRGG